MIVNSPISGKAGKIPFRLTVGKKVPDEVLKYWKSSKQIEQLIKSGAISEDENLTMSQKGLSEKSEKEIPMSKKV